MTTFSFFDFLDSFLCFECVILYERVSGNGLYSGNRSWYRNIICLKTAALGIEPLSELYHAESVGSDWRKPDPLPELVEG